MSKDQNSSCSEADLRFAELVNCDKGEGERERGGEERLETW